MLTCNSRFGPNTFPANNSALYACEVQVGYAANALVKPIIDNEASVIEVKEAVENFRTNDIQLKLQSSVFAGRCSNWYIGEFGRNVASWPGLAIEFWLATLFPDRKAFLKNGGSRFWFLNMVERKIRQHGLLAIAVSSIALFQTERRFMLLSRFCEAAKVYLGWS